MKEKIRKILELKEKCYSCKDCNLGNKLVDGLDPHVFGEGNVNAKIIFIGESAGKEEVIKKKPFQGRSGKFYEEHILKPADIDRKKIYTCNTVCCRPDEKNRNPRPDEIEACYKYLNSQICLIDPKLLVVLGNIPLDGVCETMGITKRRGKLIWSRIWENNKKYPVLPLFHPSYCLRGSGLKEMKEDVEYLKKLIEDIRSNNYDWIVKEALEV